MAEYISYFCVGLVILVLVEATVWLRVCLGLSMKHKEASFATMMVRAPYRIFWLPKVIVSAVEIVIFCVAAKYYRNGGQEIILAIVCFVALALFVALAFWEGVRAVRRYEEQASIAR